MKYSKDSIAYCGLFCPLCSIHTTGETGDRAHVDAMPNHYLFLKCMTVREIGCDGCKVNEACGPCKIRDCASKKHLVSCADCDDFPCTSLRNHAGDGIPHHQEALQHLWRIREVGYEVWFREQAGHLDCADCAKRQSWYLPCEEHRSGFAPAAEETAPADMPA